MNNTPEGWTERFKDKYSKLFQWISLNCKDEIIGGIDLNNLDVEFSNFFHSELESYKLKLRKDVEGMEVHYESFNFSPMVVKEDVLEKLK